MLFIFIITNKCSINPLNIQLNPICHILALLGAHHILHVSRIRVNITTVCIKTMYNLCSYMFRHFHAIIREYICVSLSYTSFPNCSCRKYSFIKSSYVSTWIVAVELHFYKIIRMLNYFVVLQYSVYNCNFNSHNSRSYVT